MRRDVFQAIANDIEMEAFENLKPSMNEGFGGTFNQLTDYIKTIQKANN